MPANWSNESENSPVTWTENSEASSTWASEGESDVLINAGMLIGLGLLFTYAGPLVGTAWANETEN